MKGFINDLIGRNQKIIKNIILAPLIKTNRHRNGNKDSLRPFYGKLNAFLKKTNDEKLTKTFAESESSAVSLLTKFRSESHKPAPMVNVIMVTHGGAKKLRDALNSLVGQSYNTWELLVCDTASSIKTEKQIRRLNDERIKYFKLKPYGRAAARNYGLSQSRGEYIAYLDADYIWHPNFLEVTVNTLINRGGYQCVYSQYIDVLIKKKKYQIHSFKYNYEKLSRDNLIDLHTCVHHRSLYDHFGGFKDELDQQQDWDLVLRYTFLRDPLYMDSLLVMCQKRKRTTHARKRHYDGYFLVQKHLQSYYANGLISQKQQKTEDLPSITILCWDTYHNHFARALTVAEALSSTYKVQVLGFRFAGSTVLETHNEGKSGYEMTTIDGTQFPGFHEAMSEALLKIKGDVIYAVKPHLASLGLALLANYNFRKTVILDYHDIENVDENKRLDISKINLDSKELLSPDSIIWSKVMVEYGKKMPLTVSNNKHLDEYFGGKNFLIRNATNEDYYNPSSYSRDEVRHQLGFKSSDKVLLFGGPIHKHQDKLIELADKLSEDRYKILFINSEATSNQNELAEKYGKKITFLTAQKKKDMARITYAADLLILWLDPNKPETHYQMPYVFTEAIAMKVPVIANAISDLGDLGRMGYLKLVAYGNFSGLVDEIKLIFNDRAETAEMVEAARNLYLRQFCYRAVICNIGLALEHANPALLEAAREFSEFYSDFYQNHKENAVSS